MNLSKSEWDVLSKDIQNFRKQYPIITSGDVQSFIMGWVAHAEKNRRIFLNNENNNVIINLSKNE